MPTKLQKSDAEWRAELTPEQYHILREKGTERPFTGALVNNHADGFYHCAACDAPLFKSGTKYESGSGWPSFFEPITPEAVELHEDRLGADRVAGWVDVEACKILLIEARIGRTVEQLFGFDIE